MKRLFLGDLVDGTEHSISSMLLAMPIEIDENECRILVPENLSDTFERAIRSNLELIKKVTGKNRIRIIALDRNEFAQASRITKKTKCNADSDNQSTHQNNGKCAEVVSSGILLGDMLSHEYLLGDFIVADCNRDAFATVQWIANRTDAQSVVIYGPSGVGKTHLAQGTAWWRLFEGENIAFFKAQTLISHINSCFAKGSGIADEFAQSVSHKAHWLIVDDFQMLTNPKLKGVRDVFFTILESMLAKRGKVIVVSDVPPEAWQNIHARIKQRLTLSAAVKMNPPDSEFAKRFVSEKLAKEGVEVDKEALELLSNIRLVSVRDLKKVVNGCLMRSRPVITKNIMLDVLVSVFGPLRFTNRGELGAIWELILEIYMDPLEAQEVKAGAEGALSPEAKAVLRELKAGFVKATAEEGCKPREVQIALGIGKSTFYRLLSVKETPLMSAVKDKVKEMLKGG